MRLLSGLLTTAAVAAMGFAFGALALVALPAQPETFVAPSRAAPIEPVVVSSRTVPTQWPAVFGVVPDVVIAPTPEPEPEVVELPPEENTTYWLTGVVAGGEGIDSFAMLSENDRGFVVRVGDVLIGGETVTAIDAQGVWIDYNGTKELIPVQKADLDSMISLAGADRPGSVEFLPEVSVVVEATSLNHIGSLLAEAGALSPSVRESISGMDVIYIQDGLLFDKIGLQVGDVITGVNGVSPQSRDLLSELGETDLKVEPLELRVLRNGNEQMVRVTFDQG